MDFPSSLAVMNANLSTVPLLHDFARHLIALCPVGQQVRWDKAVPDIGRYMSVIATGDFVNVYIVEGSGRGCYTYEVSIRREPNYPDYITPQSYFHLAIYREKAQLKKSDVRFMMEHEYGDIGGHLTPQIKYREDAWNRMIMTDYGFMGGRQRTRVM
jgi:hypothetical protein